MPKPNANLGDPMDYQFNTCGHWRQELYTAVDELCQWLINQPLSGINHRHTCHQVLDSIRDDNLIIAFIAEFSRGKSELINALFFGHTGSRFLPSGAGHTTMCPTEIHCDANQPASIKLLALDTASDQASLHELKKNPAAWNTINLVSNDPASIANAFSHLADTQMVSLEQATKFGLTVSGDSDGLMLNSSAPGMIEIPAWRHAIINYHHPLLKQGLVVIDTPSLNALGIEPELTLDLLSKAHATVFMLAADTGVTRSDLQLWRKFVSKNNNQPSANIVVLNKIDTLYDELREPQKNVDELNRQVKKTAAILEIHTDKVFPISAQQALYSKINYNST